ncbi:MAG: aminopeptidase, partial [Evtepia sp.]
MKERTEAQKRKEALFLNRKNGYDLFDKAEESQLEAYSKSYRAFLDAGKTERECVDYIAQKAQENGFHAFECGGALKAGDKVYRINRGKAIMLAVIGSEGLDCGANIGAAHIDAPRLDLKQYPLYEEKELAYLKTHYYGGIRKYHWVSLPLELHGVMMLADGTERKIRIGGESGDPVFTINDLLPHLAADQAKKPLGDAITAEQLNLLVGSRPFPDDEGSDRVKLAILELLHEKYGIIEEDFLSAELVAVPALPSYDVGFDRSMIGAYGQDDRVCAYACLAALFEESVPKKTAVCMLADKEEIGSEGVTGMKSAAFDVFMSDLCETQAVPLKRCYEKSFCLSADVTAAF